MCWSSTIVLFLLLKTSDRDRTLGRCHYFVVTLDQLELDSLWDFSDAAGSEARFRRAGADPEHRTQLARALGLQGRFDEGATVLDEVEASGAADADPAVRARVSLERGRLANSSGRTDVAVPLFAAAERTAREAGLEFLEIDAIHMLAIADGPRSSEHETRGLERVSVAVHPRTRRWGVSLHNNAGWSRFDAGDAAGALDEFGEALAQAVAWGTAEQQFFCRWAIARSYRELGRYSEALELQESLARLDPDDADVAEELAILRAL